MITIFWLSPKSATVGNTYPLSATPLTTLTPPYRYLRAWCPNSQQARILAEPKN